MSHKIVMKQYILLIISVTIVWFGGVSVYGLSIKLDREIIAVEIARLEYEKKLLDLENMVFVDFHVAGYEPFMCEDKRCWIKKELVPVELLEWAKWFETTDRHVGNDTINGYRISTVFLGLDHNFGVGAPLLFETMVFGDDDEEDMERYATYEEAEEGHKRFVEKYS